MVFLISYKCHATVPSCGTMGNCRAIQNFEGWRYSQNPLFRRGGTLLLLMGKGLDQPSTEKPISQDALLIQFFFWDSNAPSKKGFQLVHMWAFQTFV